MEQNRERLRREISSLFTQRNIESIHAELLDLKQKTLQREETARDI
jgi:hypothetical protein